MVSTQNQVPTSELTHFEHNPDLPILRSNSSKFAICPTSFIPSRVDALCSSFTSTCSSQNLPTTPESLKNLPVYTKCTKTKNLPKATSDIVFDRAEVTMSELIRVSSRKGRRTNTLNDGIFSTNRIDIIEDLSLNSKVDPLGSSPKIHSSSGCSKYFPKVKLKDGALVLDEESIIMKPRREKMENSSQILYESTHEMDNSKLKQKKRYKVLHWTESETHLFFKALSQFGTDFSMIQNSLFPFRSRIEIKNKFKREERQHPIRINRALRKKIPVLEFLTHEDLRKAESVSSEKKKDFQ